MTAEERNKRIQELMSQDMELLIAKGHDYSGDQDCLANLRTFGFFGVVVRIGDKFMRLASFVKNKLLKVKDESVEDTLRDLRIYCYLGQIVREEEKEKDEGKIRY